MSFLLVIGLASTIITSHEEIKVSTATVQIVIWILGSALTEAGVIFVGHLVNMSMSSHRYQTIKMLYQIYYCNIFRSLISLHLLRMKHELQAFIAKSVNLSFPRYHGAFVNPVKNSENDITVQNDDINIFNNLNDCIHTSEILLDVMQNRDEIEPLRVLGVRCTTQIPLYIISTLFLVGFVFAQYILLGSVVY
jgi:hypothetical protein